MGTVMVSPERVSGAPSGFSIRLVSVAAVAPGGMWSLTSSGVTPAHSYMRKMRASESSSFLMAVRVTFGFSMLAQECWRPVWGKTCSAFSGSLSS